MKSLGTIMSRY